jgi:hypothetical protein
MSHLFATAGSKLYIGAALAFNGVDLTAADFASQTWTEIQGTTNLGSAGDTSELITSNQIGAARTRKLKGTRNAGSMQVVCDLDYADAGQIALLAAEKAKDTYAFKLEFNDAPAARSNVASVTIATPGVFTWTGHNLDVGDAIKLSTTGALPTGLTAGATVYVKAVPDPNTFTVAATPGGAAIATSGTQSGTHTVTTVPAPSTRNFVALVMSAAEQFDEANSVMKLNATLELDSNIVRVAAVE